MEILGAHHIAILTTRFVEMEQFYTQTLGLAVVKRWDDAGISFIDIGGTRIELIGRERLDSDGAQNSGNRAGLNHLAFHVASVDQTFRVWKDRGVPVRSEPENFEDARIAFFFDPDGNVLEIFEERAQAEG